ncbi:endopeptidase La [Deltaproteobacteria bacterium TL4]
MSRLFDPIVIPMLPMREEIIFPGTTIPFFVGRKTSMEALDRALSGDRKIFVVTQKNSSVENPKDVDLFSVGVLGTVLQVMRLPNGTVKALFEAKQRAHVISTQLRENVYMAKVQPILEPEAYSETCLQLANRVKSLFKDHVRTSQLKIREEVLRSVEKVNPIQLPDLIAPVLEISRLQKQEILECLDLEARLELIMKTLFEELEILQLEGKLKNQIQEQIRSSQKEGYLQDQLHSIQKELGQMDDSKTEFEEFTKKIEEAQMPQEVQELATKELKKLKMMSPMSSESNVVRNYLEWLVSMPWKTKTTDNYDLGLAERILDEDHYGLEKVKERIIEYLAVAHLKGSLKGPIICLVGPPGVGKTSLAKSIARALDRNFVRMSLGGIRDEAEIRGHRRTYIGALPGKIIQSMRKAKSRNPVLLMDEVDKLYQSAMTDPSAALLEVLDPEQNNTFMDHYLEVEYDLSDVLFLCTANTTQNIPGPLLDRMEVIQISGYTELEKHHIATQFLIPRQCKMHGLDSNQLQFRTNAVSTIIHGYTREAGVRNLEREIGKICRKTVTVLVRSNEEKNSVVTPKLVEKLLGVPPFQRDSKAEANEIGVATGLGVTMMGGQLLQVEVGLMPGSGKVSLTGKLGDIMQESAKAAYSYVRANADYFGIDPEMFAKLDLHVHLPEGAVPKDGPSAGLPLITTMISAFTKIPVRHEVAMTGEITLRGHVTEIGGLKEKLLAAKQGLLEDVLIPCDNEKDLEEIPLEITQGLRIHTVSNVDEALHIALERYPGTLGITSPATGKLSQTRVNTEIVSKEKSR